MARRNNSQYHLRIPKTTTYSTCISATRIAFPTDPIFSKVRIMAIWVRCSQGPELCVPAVVMRKFVGKDGPKLGNVQRAEQRQTQPHHSAAAEPHQPSAICHPGVGFADEVDLARQRLSQGASDAVELRKQTRVRRAA